MESRFEHATPADKRLIKKMLKNDFAFLEGLRFLALYDNKKRTSSGKLILARVKKADDELKLLTEETEPPDGIHVIFFFDGTLFSVLSTTDKKRLIYHEFCHIEKQDVDKYIILPHDFEGFYAEIDYNSDDPNWNQRLADKAWQLHNQEKEGE